MSTKILDQVPVAAELGPMGLPIWFHHHGIKMSLTQFDPGNQVVVISASAATVTISPQEVGSENDWFVDWEVVQSRCAKTNGRIVMSGDELSAAFGVADHSFQSGAWLIERFGGHSAN
ncbi:hypothetical protein KKI23_01080 [Patescibacteria group bacterium]|nr:hypothetical protein [Patescibacteria group bacterium]